MDPQPQAHVEAEEAQHALGSVEFEVSDLRRAHTPLGAAPDARRLSPRRRALRIALPCAAVGLALLVILGGIPALGGEAGASVSLRHASFGPRVRFLPSPPAGAAYFYVFTDVPWTTVTIDGKLAHLPVAERDAPLLLSRGPHTLIWNAQPFESQRCTLTLPAASGDTCAVYPRGAVDRLAHDAAINLVVLRESLATLPASQHDALLAAVRASIAVRTAAAPLRPGERYLTTRGVVSASQLLLATLDLRLDVSDPVLAACLGAMAGASRSCMDGDESCFQLCTLPLGARPPQSEVPPSPDWLVSAVVRASWDYATPGGRLVAGGQPLAPGAAAAGVLLALDIQWDGARWHVTTPSFAPGQAQLTTAAGAQYLLRDPACAAALELFQGTGDAKSYYYVDLVSGKDPSAGCLILTSNGSTWPTSPPSNQPGPYYLERFGVLLAANAPAHTLHPALPQLSADEQQVADTLAALAGQ